MNQRLPLKKLGILEYLLISYVLIGLVWTCVCLSVDGETRFSYFLVYERYAVPTSFIVSLIGLSDELFGRWPSAIYWSAALVAVNGLVIYAVAKMITLRWRRSHPIASPSNHPTTQRIRIVLTEDEGRQLFRDQLPLSGVVEREVSSMGGNSWSLLLLDKPFDYQVQDAQTKIFKGFEVKRLLIRSRWAGCSVGDSVPTSVFVLIAGDEHLFDEEKIDPKKFYFDAWAMCQNEKQR